MKISLFCRATFGKEKISTVIHARDVNKFQVTTDLKQSGNELLKWCFIVYISLKLQQKIKPIVKIFEYHPVGLKLFSFSPKNSLMLLID